MTSANEGLHEKRLEIARDLWDAGFRVEHSYRLNPNTKDDIQYCKDNNIPLAVVLEDSNLFKLRDFTMDKEKMLPVVNLVECIRNRLNIEKGVVSTESYALLLGQHESLVEKNNGLEKLSKAYLTKLKESETDLKRVSSQLEKELKVKKKFQK